MTRHTRPLSSSPRRRSLDAPRRTGVQERGLGALFPAEVVVQRQHQGDCSAAMPGVPPVGGRDTGHSIVTVYPKLIALICSLNTLVQSACALHPDKHPGFRPTSPSLCVTRKTPPRSIV